MTKVNFPILTFNEAGIQIIDGDRGFAYPKSSDFMESGYCLFLTAQNVTSDGFKFNEGQFVSEKKHNELRNGTLQRQDIVLTSRGTVGNVALYDDRIPYDVLRINSGMLILRNSGKSFETNYLYALLRSPLFKKQIRRLSFGSAQPQITVQVTNGFEFSCPSKPEQKKIAQILSSWDRAIETLVTLIDAKTKLKKGLMQKLLNDRCGKMVRLKDVAEIIVSNVDKKAYSGQRQVLLCNYLDVYKNSYITNDLPFMQSTASDAEIRKFGLREGDVIITKDSETPEDIGVPAVVVEKLKGVVCGYHLAIIRPNQNIVDSIYFAKTMQTLIVKKQLYKFANGATRFGLGVGDIGKIEFSAPNINEQKKAARILRILDRELILLVSLQECWNRQKKGLMQKLLTGKIRVRA